VIAKRGLRRCDAMGYPRWDPGTEKGHQAKPKEI